MRNGLMLLGLLTGGALYLLWTLPWTGASGDRWWSDPLGSACLSVAMALLVQVPLWVAMAVTHWRSPRLWAGAAVMALVIAVMGGWAIAGIAEAPHHHQSVLLRLATALSLWWFVALAWFQGWLEQGWLEQGSWRIAYARLFVLAWNNALVMALAGLCVWLVWGVLTLWGGLFALLGVTLFAEIFSAPLFISLCSGLLGGLGLWLARSQERPIQMARQTLLALGYAWAGVCSLRMPEQGLWLAQLSPVNRALSLVLLALLLALQTPLLDPQRISAASQLQQLLSGRQELTLDRLTDLKFDHGRYGAEAFATLAQEPLAQGDAAQAMVQTVEKRSTRSPAPDEPAPSEEVDVTIAQQRIVLAGNSRAPSADWWQFLLQQAGSGEHWATACLWQDADCIVLSGDWDQDGQTDHLLCDMNDGVYAQCALTARAPRGTGAQAVTSSGSEAAWTMESRLRWHMHSDRVATQALDAALRAGQMEVVPQRWPQWQVQVRDADGKPKTEVGQLER